MIMTRKGCANGSGMVTRITPSWWDTDAPFLPFASVWLLPSSVDGITAETSSV